MKTKMIALALFASIAAVPAAADNIDFGQFGAVFTTLSSPVRGVTNDGIGFTLVGSSAFERLDQGNGWYGSFQTGQELLRVSSSGQMVFYFDQSLSSLNSIAVEPNVAFPFMATLNGFAAGILVATSTYTGLSGGTPGSIGSMAISGSFDSVTLSTSFDIAGFAVGGVDAIVLPPPPVGGVPEPASWATLIIGFGLVGAGSRRRRATRVAA